MARWGAHRERVEQTRRQRFGVAGRKTSERARKRARRISRPQHERSVQDVSFTFEQRPQLQRPGARTEMRSMSKAFRMYLLHPDDDLSCGGSARASARARARMRGEKTRERARERRESDESDNAVEGSEEYFDAMRSM